MTDAERETMAELVGKRELTFMSNLLRRPGEDLERPSAILAELERLAGVTEHMRQTGDRSMLFLAWGGTVTLLQIERYRQRAEYEREVLARWPDEAEPLQELFEFAAEAERVGYALLREPTDGEPH